VGEPGVPAAEVVGEVAVEDSGADLKEQVGAARGPAHLLRAAERFTGTTGWTLHQLRHSRIRELKDQGCPLPVLQKITGHRSLRTLTEHYPGPSPDAVRAWYEESDPAARRRRADTRS
jgi:integrase